MDINDSGIQHVLYVCGSRSSPLLNVRVWERDKLESE